MKLQNEICQEPATSPVAEPNKWKRGALRRSARFEHVMHALGRLMHWAMAERRDFMTRIMGVAPPTSKRVQQAVGCEDLPRVEDADVKKRQREENENGNAGEKRQKLSVKRKVGKKSTPNDETSSPVSGTVIRQLGEGETLPEIRKGRQDPQLASCCRTKGFL